MRERDGVRERGAGEREESEGRGAPLIHGSGRGERVELHRPERPWRSLQQRKVEDDRNYTEPPALFIFISCRSFSLFLFLFLFKNCSIIIN